MTGPDEHVVKLTRPTDFEILEAFSDGEQDVGVNVATELDRDRSYINTRIPQLHDYGLLEYVGPAERSGVYRITEGGVAALALRDQYDSGPEWEQLVNERAKKVEIVRPKVLDHADD